MKVAAAIITTAVAGSAIQFAAAADAPSAPPGAIVFNHWCQPCHGAGPHHPATAALEFKYKGAKPAALLERSDLDLATIKYFVRHGAGNMAPFRKTELTDADLSELAVYLSHSSTKSR